MADNKIVNSLFTKYDEEVAKRVYAEDRIEEVVIKLLKLGTAVEVVVEATGLDEVYVKQLNEEFVLSRS